MNDARPIFSGNAADISADSLGMSLYTNQKQDDVLWSRRGTVDSFYIDTRAGLVSIGVDQRDIIDVDITHNILLMPKPAK
jgi:hypothetical protein